MKLARLLLNDKPSLGIVKADKILPILPQYEGDMIKLIDNWDELKPQLEQLSSSLDGWLELVNVKLLAPVARPGKMMAIGLNYADHIAETGRETPEHQVWFAKMPSSINGPYDDIQIPKIAPNKIDYEIEMIAIIGKGGRHISKSAAPKAIFGYCIGNDVSVRDWQRLTPQWSLAKSFDTHSPIGPWITTADEVGDPHRFEVCLKVNGDKRQVSNTKHLIFNVWDQVSYLSDAMTMEAGDVIFTGTPGGVGNARVPPVYLQENDIVRLEIEELGFIEGKMVFEV